MFVHDEKKGILVKDARDWEELLASDQGIFKKLPKNKSIVGPHFIDREHIQGDMLAMEINHLMEHGTEEQKNYYFRLLDLDETKAYQYLLTVTNAMETWEEDMQVLWYAKSLLNSKINNIESSARRLVESLKLEKFEKIPSTIKNHIPEHFFDIDVSEKDFIELLEKITQSEKEVRKRHDRLSEYIEKRREQMPFLFENFRYI